MDTKLRLPGFLIAGLLLAACGESATSEAPTMVASAPATSVSPSVSADESAVPSADEPSTAASAAASAAPDAELPDGWRLIAGPDLGFSIGVPESWDELSAESLTEGGVFDEMIETNPDAAVALEQARAAIESGQIGLFAFDSQDAGTGFATNLNVIEIGPVSESPAEAAEQIATAIEASVPIIGEVSTETTNLPAGEAAVITYEWEVADASGAATEVTVNQYAIITDAGNGYVVSFSAASDGLAEDEGTFREIVETFRAGG